MGGITGSVLALCSGLRNLGHEVKVLGLSNCNKSFIDGDNYFIRSFPAFYYPGMRMSFAKKDALLRELAKWQPDIIHIQTEGSARKLSNVVMKHCNAKIVMTSHTDYGHFLFGRFKNRSIIKHILSMIGYLLYRKATKITVPSEKAANFSFIGKMKDYITVVPNGMELEKYKNKFTKTEKMKFRKSLGINNNTKVLVSISRISKEKNIRELISFLPELQKKYKNVKLLIVGDGPDKKHLEKLTDKLHLRDSIIFTGRIPSENVWKYYAAGDIFVSGSTFEVHSMSYLEALANGLPLLCREDDSLKGVLEHNKNGFIYCTKNEYIEYAYKLLTKDNLREKMANCSSKKSEEFSPKSFANSMIEVYKEAINDDKRNKKGSKKNEK